MKKDVCLSEKLKSMLIFSEINICSLIKSVKNTIKLLVKQGMRTNIMLICSKLLILGEWICISKIQTLTMQDYVGL